MTRRTRFSTGGLIARHLATRPWGSVLLGLLLAICICGLAIVPQVLNSLADEELRYEITSISPPRVDVSGSTKLGIQDIEAATVEGVFGEMDEAISAIPKSTPAPLGDLMGEASWIAQLGATPVTPAEPLPGLSPQVRLAIDLRAADRVSIVDGVAPSVWSGSLEDLAAAEQPLDIAVSRAAAATLSLSVGDELESPLVTLRVSAVFEAVDAADPYWVHAGDVLDPVVLKTAGSPDTVIVSAYIDPLSARGLGLDLAEAALKIWYQTLVPQLEYAQTGDLLKQVQQIATVGESLPNGQRLVFQSGLTPAVEDVIKHVSTFTALLALVGSAPLGVVLAALVLGIRTVVLRRQLALDLTVARGASTFGVQRVMVMEGVVIAIPALIIGITAAALVAGIEEQEALSAPLLLAATVPIVFALSLRARSGRSERIDLQARGRSPIRWIIEVAVSGLAVVAYLLLLRRGLVVSTSIGVDPLLAATPLLLSLAVCIIVLRLYPFPLLALQRRIRARRGAVGLLGSARAVREPAIGLVAVVAMLVAVSTAVCSLVLAATVTTALETNARSQVGGDVRIDSFAITIPTVEALRKVPGVSAVAPLQFVPGIDLRSKSRLIVTLIVADTVALHAVRPEFPELVGSQGMPVLVSADLDDRVTGSMTINGQDGLRDAVAPADAIPGVSGSWVLIDSAFANTVLERPFEPTTVVLAAEDSATAAIGRVIPEEATRVDSSAILAASSTRPTVSGLRAALAAASTLSAVMASLTVVLAAVASAPARNRLMSIVHILGMSRRQLRLVVAWEIAPVAITAIAAGIVVGVGMPFVILGVIDVSDLIGGASRVGITIPWPMVAAGALGFSALVALAGASSIVVAHRVDPARQVKIGAE